MDEEDNKGKTKVKKPKTKAAPKKDAAKKGGPAEDVKGGAQPQPVTRRHSQKQAQKEEETGPDKRCESILAGGSRTLQSLVELKADSIWQSLIRANELDRRLSKASSIPGELQKVSASDKANSSQKERAATMEDGVASSAKVISALKETCRIFRSDTCELAKAIQEGGLAEQIQICSKKLFSEPSVLMDMIHVAAKKLVEALQNTKCFHWIFPWCESISAAPTACKCTV